MADPEGDDVMANNILATGAVWAALTLPHTPGLIECKPEMVNGDATNTVLVRFDFLKSQYRLTVELVPGTEVEDE